MMRLLLLSKKLLSLVRREKLHLRKKVKEIPAPDHTRDTPTGYRFMDMNLLGLVFSVVSCPRCKLQSLTMVQNTKQGFEMSCHVVTTVGVIRFGHPKNDPNIMM